MTGKTHAVIGANTVWLLPIFGQSIQPLYVPVAMLSALLPDLDASESMIKNLDVRVGKIRVKPFYIPAIIFSSLFHHRGWLHSGVAILIVAALSWATLRQFDVVFPILITLGYASHIIADACTISGVQFFLPATNELHLLPKPLRIVTGSVIDTLLFIVGSLGLAALLPNSVM